MPMEISEALIKAAEKIKDQVLVADQPTLLGDQFPGLGLIACQDQPEGAMAELHDQLGLNRPVWVVFI